MWHVTRRFLGGCVFVVIIAALPAATQSQTHLWSQRFGSIGFSDFGTGIATDGAGNVLVTGYFGATADLGGGPLTSAGLLDIFVAKYNASGTHVWSQRFGDTGNDQGRAIAVDGAGNVLVTGDFLGTVDFGGGPLTSAGGNDIFVAKYDASGTHVWSQRFGIFLNGDRGLGIAVDGAGNVLVTGYFQGSVDFGGGPLAFAGGSDIFVAKYDPGGTHIWSQRFGDTGFDQGNGIAVDAANNVLVIGEFLGTVDFGGGPLTSAGQIDIFAARYDPGGTHIWSQRFGDTGKDHGRSITADGASNVLVTGDFQGTADFGGGPLTSAGSADIVVAKYQPSGTHLWSQRFGSTVFDQGNGISADGAGNVFLTGGFSGTVDFGGGPLVGAGSEEIFVAKYDPSGIHLWSRVFSSANSEQGNGITADGAGDVVVTGFLTFTVDLGGGPLATIGGGDIFVARYTTPPVAATLQAFESYWAGSHVEVMWQLIDIEGELTFDVSRMEGSSGSFVSTQSDPIIQRGSKFIFEDHSTKPGTTYRYRVVIIEDGEAVTSFETTVTTPSARFALEQNHPNPFNPVTGIRFSIDQERMVTLSIYDIFGRLVTTLVDRKMRAGVYIEAWDGRDVSGNAVASGVYFYRLTAGNRALTRKAVLLK